MPHKDEACHHEWIVTDDYDLHGCAKCGVVGGPVTRSALKAQIAKLRGITEQQEREIVRLMALVKELTDAARRESR